MADVFSAEKRSQIMSRVRGSGNLLTEERLARVFRANKITGWRRRTQLFGKPDFVFTKAKLAVFVDGCFWHSCPSHGARPATNPAFWTTKLEQNKRRDRLVNRTLRKLGWKVIRVWQHDLKHPGVVLHRIAGALNSHHE